MRWMALPLLILTHPALADPAAEPRPAAGKALKAVDCYCTDSTGGRVELGDTICLFVDGRAYLAQCQMSLNTPAWRDVGESCVSSSLRARLTRHPG